MASRLDSSPAILPLYVKAALPLLPGASALPFVPGGGDDVPEGLGFTLEGVRPDRAEVAAYAKVCGFSLRDSLPVTYPHILAFPLQMKIMSDGEFPFGAVGLVHVENTIEQIRPIRFGETLDVKVESSRLLPHPKGRAFTLFTEVSVAGETVWTESSTMLRRGRGDESAAASQDTDPVPSLGEEAPATAIWALGGDLGRRYGAVSGDRNPIHMHALTAKPLGFNSAIAHGMWTKARALAQLESRLPDSFKVDVRFKRPIPLPSKVEFATDENGDETDFTVRNARKGTPHLDGRIRATQPDGSKKASK